MKTAFAVGAALLLAGCALDAPSAVEPPAAAISGQTQSAARGETMVRARCSGCHAVGADDSSPLTAAPTLRSIGSRYPVGQLEEAFAEGIVSSHSVMPEFVLSADDIRDLIAYLDTLQSVPADGAAQRPFDPG